VRITSVADLHVDGGWDRWSYLKISTDEGLVGWAEFSEERGRAGISVLLRDMAPKLVGQDPGEVGRIVATLVRDTRATNTGLMAMAIGAIENALLDLRGKELGVPARELIGGTLRSSIPAYWSHCGMYRINHPEHFTRPVRTLDDLRDVGAEVAAAGFGALKTNLMAIGRARPAGGAMTIRGTDAFGMNIETNLLHLAVDLLGAFRDGAGDAVRLALDVNFNYKPEGLRQLAHILEPLDLMWLEADTSTASGLAAARASTKTPIASLETILGRRALRPFLEAESVDVALIDAVFNGAAESARMAAMCDAYEVNVAAHNAWSPLGTLINAGLCAVIPNFRILEYDHDAVPWRDDLFDEPLTVDRGSIILNNRPGWGIEPNEDVMRAHAATR
jgi:L-alanine-DL-glutamate epimerase-like enolase superfamily enzyme